MGPTPWSLREGASPVRRSLIRVGVSLSGGEKQRLALARGLLAAEDSEIILMDEPTSSVDPSTELKIYENILKNYKNKTIISSIHRYHLLSKFDYIYLFSKGKVIDEGTFRQLLAKNNTFKKNWEKYRKAVN